MCQLDKINKILLVKIQKILLDSEFKSLRLCNNSDLKGKKWIIFKNGIGKCFTWAINLNDANFENLWYVNRSYYILLDCASNSSHEKFVGTRIIDEEFPYSDSQKYYLIADNKIAKYLDIINRNSKPIIKYLL